MRAKKEYFSAIFDIPMHPSKSSTDSPLIGRRVLLRPPQESDCEALLALNRASSRFHRGLVPAPVKPVDFDAYLERSQQYSFRCFLICRKTDGALLGAINLGHIIRGNLHSAFLGYYIGAPFARNGYMTEAMQLILRYAFKILKLHRIEANIQPGNAASVALVSRAGFQREGFSRRYLKVLGRWKDHERWAILAEDWRAKGGAFAERGGRVG